MNVECICDLFHYENGFILFYFIFVSKNRDDDRNNCLVFMTIYKKKPLNY